MTEQHKQRIAQGHRGLKHSQRGKPHASFYEGTDLPMGFGAYGRIMQPVTWILDLIIKLLSKLVKKGG